MGNTPLISDNVEPLEQNIKDALYAIGIDPSYLIIVDRDGEIFARENLQANVRNITTVQNLTLPHSIPSTGDMHASACVAFYAGNTILASRCRWKGGDWCYSTTRSISGYVPPP